MGRRGAVMAAWLLGVALCALQVAQTRFVADLSSFLPERPTAQQRMLVEQLRHGALSRVMLVGIEGADAPTRARIARALAARLRADPRFALVADGAGAGFERERELLLAHRYALSAHVTPQRFSVEGLREAIGETVEALASPAGLLLRTLVPRDPTGEMLAVMEQLRPPAGPALAQGAWVSPDGRRALLLARTRASGSDTDAQAATLAALESAFAGVAQGTAARLVVSGPGVFSVRARAMIESEVKRLSALAVAAIVALLLLAYRSPSALGLGLVPVASGVLAGIAAVSVGFGTVHGITVGFGTTLIGEAVDYSIYHLVQGRSGDPAAAERFWPTIRLGVLTSIAGFSAMLFSGLPGLAQLGVYSITGLSVAALVTRFVLPSLIPARVQVRDLSAVGERLAALAGRLAKLRAVAAVVAAGAVAVIASHGGWLFDRELSRLNPIAEADRRLDAELREALGASDARLLVAAPAASREQALQAAERIGARLEPLVASGRIGGYESPARVLPSEATQRARLASLPEAATLRARLQEALAGSPLRLERLGPFIEDVARAREDGMLGPEEIAGTALEAAVDGFLVRDAEGRWTALLGLRPGAGGLDEASVAAAVGGSGVAGAVLIDVKREVDRLYAGYFQRALLAAAAGLAAIVAMLFAALRSPRRVARVVLPLIAGVLLAAAATLLQGERLSLFHLVGLLLVVAIGSNYALFFDRLAIVEAGTGRTFASIALANLTTVTCFGILGLSNIPVLDAIGETVAIGAFATLLFAAMFAAPPAAAPVPANHGRRRR